MRGRLIGGLLLLAALGYWAYTEWELAESSTDCLKVKTCENHWR